MINLFSSERIYYFPNDKFWTGSNGKYLQKDKLFFAQRIISVVDKIENIVVTEKVNANYLYFSHFLQCFRKAFPESSQA